jgi:hypothetical protein
MPTTFVALYRGRTVSSAHLVAVSNDPHLIADVSARLLTHQQDEEADPVVARLERGRRAALRLMRKEAADAPTPA